ncbi:MAG: hypothetical protein QOF61_1364 [Acidobacteriota bacterium]|jgi:hypothetical protein|nr:hypothetical protein [Acidobacteriota bacterium]
MIEVRSCVARVITAAFVLLMAVATCGAQTQSGCSLIEKNRPAQFITFESFNELISAVKFRLRNNSTCAIVVETDDKSPTKVSRLSNGSIKIERVTDSQNEALLAIHYQGQDKKRWRAPANGYGWGDSVFTYEIQAGESAFFFVPLRHLKKQLDLAVPFNYAWEGDRSIGMGVGGVAHRVYFFFEDLPEEARQGWKRRG